MKTILMALLWSASCGAALAAPSAPVESKPPRPPVHTVTLTPEDEQALAVAITYVGGHCETDLKACAAKIQLSDWAKRAAVEMQAQDAAPKTKPKP